MELGFVGENKTREMTPNDCELCVMDNTGDTKTIWSKDNEDEIENARGVFDRLTAKGYLAFSVTKDGKAGKKMTKFDPNAEKMILSPPVAGG